MLLSERKKNLILEKHLELEGKLLSIFEKEVNVEELKSIIIDIQNLREETISKMKLNIPSINHEIKIVSNSLTPELISYYNEVKTEIQNIRTCLEKEGIPTLNLNLVTNFLENFSILLDERVAFDKISLDDKILILSEDNKKHNLCLRQGKKIILTKRNFDLSQFTHDELIEILKYLDLIIKDDSYDYLRNEIVLQINSISNITKI